MKNNRNDLHVEHKHALIIMLIVTLLYSMIGILAVISLKTDCAWISSLFRSNYTYSATVVGSLSQNGYFRINAGISFTISKDSQSGLNAEILMQQSDSYYTNAVDWNTGPMDAQSVAITAGLAKANKLSVGDKLYSRHVVDGTIREYTIEFILPEISGSRVTKSGINTDGIILMGYDMQYVSNITHTSLAFTDEPIGKLAEATSMMPSNIMYRTDEIAILSIKILPYVALFVLLDILITIALVRSLTRTVSFNFRRLAALGYEQRRLNCSYFKLVYSIGIVSVLISFVVVFALLPLFTSSLALAFVVCFLMVIQVATLLISSRLSNRQLWR